METSMPNAAAALIAAATGLAACAATPAPPAPAPSGVVEGQAFYRERIAPPPGATVRVVLYNAALQDLPGVLAEQTLPAAGGPPWAFRLAYDPGRIDAGLVYAVRAELRDADGRVLFRSRGRDEVITHGAPERLEVLMTQAE